MNELFKNLENLVGYGNIQEALKLTYVIKAWEKLSIDGILEEELTFNNFYTQKVEVKKLTAVFEKLAKKIKLFELYSFDYKMFDDQSIVSVLGLAKNSTQLPIVNDAFYGIKGMHDFSVSNQIAELGIKLLDGSSRELYVPFTNGFAYTQYTDKQIYADFQNPQAAFIAELINILEDQNIVFDLTNALENPTFINKGAPHLLKEFDAVLSFPPFSLRGKLEINKDAFHRFQFQRGTVLDIAHFEHILAQTKGKAVVLMPVGFTYRGGADEEFRKYLVDKNYLEAIIQLPPNLHSATSIETTFFIINKQKGDDKVHFINLKDDSFIIRDGRRLVLKNLDDIIDIYENKKELDNIAVLVSNDDIAMNNYSFAIDRYVISNKSKELQTVLDQFDLISLEDMAEIRRSQLFKDEGDGKEVYEVSPSDLNRAGFTLECGKVKQIGSQYKRLQTYKLEPYDVLLSTKGTIGKVGIMGEISEAMIASQAIQVIRVNGENKKEKAIALYMFLKSDIGQTVLSSLVVGVAMPQIATAEIKQLGIPILSKEQQKHIRSSFDSELKMYNEIEQLNNQIKSIHANFLGNK
jgi:type I restriction enzyme M protein